MKSPIDDESVDEITTNSSPHAICGVHENDVATGRAEHLRRAKTGESRTHDEYVGVTRHEAVSVRAILASSSDGTCRRQKLGAGLL